MGNTNSETKDRNDLGVVNAHICIHCDSKNSNSNSSRTIISPLQKELLEKCGLNESCGINNWIKHAVLWLSDSILNFNKEIMDIPIAYDWDADVIPFPLDRPIYRSNRSIQLDCPHHSYKIDLYYNGKINPHDKPSRIIVCQDFGGMNLASGIQECHGSWCNAEDSAIFNFWSLFSSYKCDCLHDSAHILMTFYSTRNEYVNVHHLNKENSEKGMIFQTCSQNRMDFYDNFPSTIKQSNKMYEYLSSSDNCSLNLVLPLVLIRLCADYMNCIFPLYHNEHGFYQDNDTTRKTNYPTVDMVKREIKNIKKHKRVLQKQVASFIIKGHKIIQHVEQTLL